MTFLAWGMSHEVKSKNSDHSSEWTNVFLVSATSTIITLTASPFWHCRCTVAVVVRRPRITPRENLLCAIEIYTHLFCALGNHDFPSMPLVCFFLPYLPLPLDTMQNYRYLLTERKIACRITGGYVLEHDTASGGCMLEHGASSGVWKMEHGAASAHQVPCVLNARI